jgi:hypothetical protein
MVLKNLQDKLYRDVCFYIHHRGRYCGSMFSISHFRLNLSLGSRGWRKKIRALLWLCCCLVEYDCLDNLLRQYVTEEILPSSSLLIDLHIRQYSVGCQLYAIGIF